MSSPQIRKQNISNMESPNKWSLKMSKNLDLEIIHHPPKMRSVVNLIIAMERMRAGMFECKDEELLSFMLESIVEGEHIKKQTIPTACRVKRKEIMDGF